jgi:hypothetical protein
MSALSLDLVSSATDRQSGYVRMAHQQEREAGVRDEHKGEAWRCMT